MDNMKGVVSFNLFGIYGFRVAYEASIKNGKLVHAWETEVLECGYDVYDSRDTEALFYNRLNLAIEQDVNERLKTAGPSFAEGAGW